ncbi:hypothetical protein [Bacillus paranthracis]|uniref:hypothetical protein n=1 Tax=Bacillus paranthracis TaxID=2026186 RepID=UPI0022E10BF1|nr:hypothetical protein [Bacillus paranthracis]
MNVVDMISDIQTVSETTHTSLEDALCVIKEWERLKGNKLVSSVAVGLTPIKVPTPEPNPYQVGVKSGMMYFEFNKHEYWALIAADTVDKAYEIYANEIGGIDAESVRKEGQASPVSTQHALDKYIKSRMDGTLLKDNFHEEFTVDFFKHYNSTVLMDASL